MSAVIHRGTARKRRWSATELVLGTGALSSAFWIAANEAVAAPLYQSYSRLSQSISELSALDAPSRSTLVPMIGLYEAMVLAFGVGVWRVARGRRSLKISSALLVTGGGLGLLGLAFPLTQRLSTLEPGATLPVSDQVHNILNGGIGPLLMLATMGSGAAAFGRRFRWYSALSGVALLAGGVLTVVSGPYSGWMGAFERLNAWVWMLWVAVLSLNLLRTRSSSALAS